MLKECWSTSSLTEELHSMLVILKNQLVYIWLRQMNNLICGKNFSTLLWNANKFRFCEVKLDFEVIPDFKNDFFCKNSMNLFFEIRSAYCKSWTNVMNKTKSLLLCLYRYIKMTFFKATWIKKGKIFFLWIKVEENWWNKLKRFFYFKIFRVAWFQVECYWVFVYIRHHYKLANWSK